MAGRSKESIDVLRKTVIIGCLVAGMILLHRFASPSDEFDPTGMLALGFVILASYTVGELVGVIKLPHITGYLFAGLVLGPSFAHLLPDSLSAAPFDKGVLNEEVISQLSLFNTLALALIALTAGGELKLSGLKRGLKQIFGVLAGQSITIFILIPALVIAISGVIPGIGLESFQSFGLVGSLLIGTVLASISLATSPAATIAVINESRAKGPVTETTLAAVVLKDVIVVILFSITAALTVSMLGSQETALGPFAGELAWHVFGSLLIGMGIGAIMALYLSWVRQEVLLFLVGVIFTTAFAATKIHLDPALLFIAAGFTASNFSKKGDTLIHEVERLSAPVYVVFFTMAGAKLHLDTLVDMAPYAIALVVVRCVALYIGVRGGAVASGAQLELKKYGWLGFISQAGVALTLAERSRDLPDPALFPGAGDTLATLVIAGIALNEVFGPIALKLGLGLSGELAASEQKDDSVPARGADFSDDHQSTETNDLDTEQTDISPLQMAVFTPLQSSSETLNHATLEWQEDVQQLITDFIQGPLADASAENQQYLKNVRRELLRYQRRLHVAASEPIENQISTLRLEQQTAAERWRQLVLTRAYNVTHRGWDPRHLVHVLDNLVEGLPETLRAPIEPETLTGQPGESPIYSAVRLALRMRKRLEGFAGPLERRINYQALVRYYFSGLAPSKLEPVAAILVNAEDNLAHHSHALFGRMLSITEELIEALRLGNPLEVRTLKSLRRLMEEDFNLASSEVERTYREAGQRLARILAAQQQELNQDLIQYGTLDLPSWKRRYSLAFGARTTGMERLGSGYSQAREGVAGRLRWLALELEMLGFRGLAIETMENQGVQLGRNIQGKGIRQVERVHTQLQEVLTDLETTLNQEQNPAKLMESIRTLTEPLHRTAIEGTASTEELVSALQSEKNLSALLDQLIRHASTLTDAYALPVKNQARGEWKLSEAPAMVDVPFRRVLVATLETEVAKELSQKVKLASQLATEIHTLIYDFERLVPFNVELVSGDLSILEDEVVPEETRDLIKDMLLGALRRAQQRLSTLLEAHHDWGHTFSQEMQHILLTRIEHLRNEMSLGDVSALSARLRRDVALRQRLAKEASGLRRLVAHSQTLAKQSLTQVVGSHRVHQWTVQLGLTAPSPKQAVTAADFIPQAPKVEVPVVYRRLFSDRALEAGDLLTGREQAFQRALQTLQRERTGTLRSVALVGDQGVGKRAIISALARKHANIHTITPKAPMSEDQFDECFTDLGSGKLVLIENLHWLSSMHPGGDRPLRKLAEYILNDHGRNAFVLVANTPFWEYATRATSVGLAMAEVIQLPPFSATELSSALLARHAMSGYTLVVPTRSRLPWPLSAWDSSKEHSNSPNLDVWFEDLHRKTAGVMQDALRMWLAAIVRVDEKAGIIEMGKVPMNLVQPISLLDDNLLLALRQIARQGWMTPALHAYLFRTHIHQARALLGQLEHLGLITEDGETYVLPDRHAGALYQTLRARGWSQ